MSNSIFEKVYSMFTKSKILCCVVAVSGLTFLGVFLLFFSKNISAKPQSQGLLPDLRTVVPQHLQIVNEHQREVLRFSNGVANVGDGPWQMRPEFPLSTGGTQDAIQEILDAQGNIVERRLVSQFEFHETHNHWHINGIAQFEVRIGGPNGPILFNDRGQSTSLKTTFCLIDWYKLNDNSPTTERVYFECSGELQGISVGWVDQYHQATDGQQLDITGAATGRYYLVSTANHESIFYEKDLSNNTAWVGFDLSRDSKGNPKINIVEHSPCEDVAGLCGENAPNR